MRNLTGIALLLSLVACATKNNNDECEDDPSLPQCQPAPVTCLFDADCNDNDPCTQSTCSAEKTCVHVNTCTATSSVDSVLFVNPNGSAFHGTRVDLAPAMDQFIDAEEAELASIPVGSCLETDFPDIDGEPEPASLGNVQLFFNDTLLIDVGDDQGLYEELIDPGTLTPGDELDFATTGAGVFEPVSIPGMFALPPAFPQITGVDPGTNTFTLTTTIAFPPIQVGFVRFRFSFLEGQNSVNLSCLADGASGTLAIDPTTFARLPVSGSVSMNVFNRAFHLLTTTDGIARSLRATTSMTTNVQYIK